MIASQQACQSRRNALRQHRWHLRSKAQKLEMRNAPQPPQQPTKSFIRQGERISPGQQDVTDGGSSLDICCRSLPLLGAEAVLTTRVAHHTGTCAVTAV